MRVDTTRIRSELDQTTDNHQHERFVDHTYHFAAVRRIINMSAAATGCRGQSAVLLLRRLASHRIRRRDRGVVLP
jgi:hypothetical protein